MDEERHKELKRKEKLILDMQEKLKEIERKRLADEEF